MANAYDKMARGCPTQMSQNWCTYEAHKFFTRRIPVIVVPNANCKNDCQSKSRHKCHVAMEKNAASAVRSGSQHPRLIGRRLCIVNRAGNWQL